MILHFCIKLGKRKIILSYGKKTYQEETAGHINQENDFNYIENPTRHQEIIHTLKSIKMLPIQYF